MKEMTDWSNWEMRQDALWGRFCSREFRGVTRSVRCSHQEALLDNNRAYVEKTT